MKTHPLIIILLLLTSCWGVSISSTFAQDHIYTKDNQVLKGNIINFNNGEVEFTQEKESDILTQKISNILLIINRKGNILLGEELAQEPEERANAINNFKNSPKLTSKYDLLVYKQAIDVVRCNITYESNDIVNFKTIKTNDSQTENKKDLLLILYVNGNHKFLASPNELADNLKILKKKIIEKADIVATAEPALPSTITLSPSEIQSYRKKAELKVDGFSEFLNLIANKELSSEEKDKAIEQAIKLFTPNATIQVSLRKPDGNIVVVTRKIEEYLKRLKLSPYSSVKIDWTDIQYVGNLQQEKDGNYYGVITGEQRFSGYDKKGNVKYSDIVKKDVKVMVKSYKKIIDANENSQWEVFLGNIGIVEQK